MARPLIAKIEYNHDCICSDVPERHPDMNIRYLSELSEDHKNISHLFNVSGQAVSEFIESIRSHHTTASVQVLRKMNGSADIITVTKKEASTKEALRESGCAFISSPVYSSGSEVAHIFAPSFGSLKCFMDSLKNSYNMRIASKKFLNETEPIRTESLLKSGYLEFVSATDVLTKRQAEALRIASSMSYYEIPKRTSLKAISEKMGISEAATSELLRKAEHKLLPTIAKILELQN